MSVRGRVAPVAAAAVAVALPTSAYSVARLDLLLVVGGTVLDAAAVATLLWGGSALVAVGVVAAVALRGGPDARPPAVVTTLVVGVLLVAALLGSAIGVGSTLLFGAIASGEPSATTILRPPPGLACPVVVREGGQLRTTVGRLSVISPSGVANAARHGVRMRSGCWSATGTPP